MVNMETAECQYRVGELDGRTVERSSLATRGHQDGLGVTTLRLCTVMARVGQMLIFVLFSGYMECWWVLETVENEVENDDRAFATEQTYRENTGRRIRSTQPIHPKCHRDLVLHFRSQGARGTYWLISNTSTVLRSKSSKKGNAASPS